MGSSQVVPSFLIKTALQCDLEVVDDGVERCANLVRRVREKESCQLAGLNGCLLLSPDLDEFA